MVDAAVGILIDIEVADAHTLLVCLFKAVEVERGIVSHVRLDDLCGKEVAVIGGMVAKEKFYLRPFLDDDEDTPVYHEVNIRTKDVDHLYGTFDGDAFGHIDQKSVLCEHGIEGGDAIVGSLCQLSIVFRHELWLSLCLFP